MSDRKEFEAWMKLIFSDPDLHRICGKYSSPTTRAKYESFRKNELPGNETARWEMPRVMKTILKADLIQRGVSEIKTNRIIDELEKHAPKVQRAFYYRCLGLTHDDIAQLIGCSRVYVGKLLKSFKKSFKLVTF